MTNYHTLKQILHGSIVTISGSVAYLDKYRSTYCIVDFAFIKQLTYMDIIEKDSGNFETDEQHYLICDKFIKRNRESKTKTILLKTMDDHVNDWIRMHYTYRVHPPYLEFEKAFQMIIKNTIRKKKLEKLKNESTIL